ncbi:MAG: molybdopterin-synthase adenylyltransferase MoeB [Methylophilaceae bacterium]|nr:molybdopterin-synthase adenylyltransferase MoeB [Methylophilaceae bacterium]
MNDQQLLRYSRHILLPQIAYEGQEQLGRSHALIVGAGGLGSPVALYLGAGGVGRLTICDYDSVDMSNLQRQVIHTTQTIGVNKAISAQRALQAINPEITVVPIPRKSSEDEFTALAREADVVIDCSDNFRTRYTLNRVCVALEKPLVSGAAIGFEGQVTVFDLRRDDSPCYHCLFPDTGAGDGVGEMRCAEFGVFAPLVGMIGTTQAAEAMKLLLGIGDSLQGRLLLLDVLAMEWRGIRLGRDPACRVCSGR